MSNAYYSTVVNHPAAEVWAVIRPFDHYAWAGVRGETTIESGKAGDQVGAIRRITTGDKIVRQILLAHSDRERSYTYALCDPPPFPVRDYVATIRVAPIVESNETFVEWWATFDCAAGENDHWTHHFEKEGFAKWLSALRDFMATGEEARQAIGKPRHAVAAGDSRPDSSGRPLSSHSCLPPAYTATSV